LRSDSAGTATQQSGIHAGITAWSWDALGSAGTLCAQAEVAEALGFHSFWLPENHFGARLAIPAPLLLLAAVAARTRRIRLGCTSYLLPIRHPLLAAEEVAVLDHLCEGRLILGLGRGLSGAMFKAFGVAAGDKRKLFKANLEVMLGAWRGDAVGADEEGQPIYLAPRPLQQPSPPLWVAAFGPLALQQVAALGLPYLASPVESLAVLEANYRRYHLDLAAAGQPAVTTIPVMRTVFITNDGAQAARVRAALSVAVPSAMRNKDVAVDDWAIVGDRHYARDKLAEYRERLNFSHLIVRAGIAGISAGEELHSHEQLLGIVDDL
jgi:alkanesulfonate monooxygenase SsuD/methylene tetrahydromethanopterin reductase-like flavin-dependent oxidoreductase (luciferase family)